MLKIVDVFRGWVDDKSVAAWIAVVLTFGWLVIVIPFLSLRNDGVRPFFSPENKGNQDLAHYYMGGAICVERAFDSLYPIPKDDLIANVGWPDSSVLKPGYAAIAEARGVENSFRFILPPPTTLLLAPVSLFPYPSARWVWVGMLGFCCWGVCWLSYRVGTQNNVSRCTALFWVMFWAFSPLMLKTLRTANSTPMVALALGLGAFAIFRDRRVMAVGACLVAGLFKGTSLIFVPFILFTRRWKIAMYGCLAVIVLNGVTLAWAGVSVYREFIEIVYPSTNIPDPFLGNQSVNGFVFRLGGGQEFDPVVMFGVKGLGLGLMALVIVRVWFLRRQLSSNLEWFVSAVVAVLGLYLIFGSYCWDHYVLFYLPFWTLLWGRARSWRMKLLLLFFAAMVWLPLTVVRGGTLLTAEPAQSHMLWGQVALIAFAASGLFTRNSCRYEGEYYGE